MGSFFGLSFLFHLCLALLFTACADRIMNNYRQEVFYIDLNQSSLPIAAPADEKPKQAAVKPRQAPVPVKAAQPVKAPAPPMQQTVFSETAKPLPMSDPKPVSGPVQEERVTQSGGSAQTASSGIPAEGAAPVGDVEFGSGSNPHYIKKVKPVYPTIAKRFNKEGTVILRLTIDAAGSLLAVEVLQDPGYGFAAAAIEAMKRSRFSPMLIAGRPVRAKARASVRFEFTSD